MEQLCVTVYEPDAEQKKLIHDALAAYAISHDTEIIIKWLKAKAKDREVQTVAHESRIAFINAGDAQHSVSFGTLIAKENPACGIVYYGGEHPQESRELIEYFSALIPSRPVSYLHSPTERDYYKALNRQNLNAASSKLFLWETKGMKYRVPLGSILYFRSERNYVSLHLKNGEEYSFLGKLANVESQLPPQLFLRAHQSYLVNIAEIMLIDKQKKSLRLSNGEEIFISKAHYKESLEI